MQRYAFFLKYLLCKVIANNFILYVKLVDVVSLKKQYVFVVETGWLIVHKKDWLRALVPVANLLYSR